MPQVEQKNQEVIRRRQNLKVWYWRRARVVARKKKKTSWLVAESGASSTTRPASLSAENESGDETRGERLSQHHIETHLHTQIYTHLPPALTSRACQPPLGGGCFLVPIPVVYLLVPWIMKNAALYEGPGGVTHSKCVPMLFAFQLNSLSAPRLPNARTWPDIAPFNGWLKNDGWMWIY